MFRFGNQPLQLQHQEFSNVKVFEDTSIVMPEAIVENSFDRSVVVWPNPCADVIEARSDKIMDEIVITNAVTGRVVKQKTHIGAKQTKLTVKDLAPGVYLVTILEENGNRHTVKLIKTK